MSIHFYRLSDIAPADHERLLRRAQADIDAVDVSAIIEAVRNDGDAALHRYAAEFDGADDIGAIKCTPEEFDAAEAALDEDLKAAIAHCAGNVKRFHVEQMRRAEKDAHWMVEVEPGVMAGEKVSPIPSVGLYVPRGKGAFPSALYMLAIPAVIAGVPDIAVCTPPRADGKADDATLYTARLCGVDTVYKVGGAQAIAALAYGTDTIKSVCKVLGPGNAYVSAAKRALSGVMDAGMPAGPSESLILCDGSANPHNTCLDVLNEAEHGMDSAALLVTHDKALADYVAQHLPGVIADLPEPHRSICDHVMSGQGSYGGVVLTDSLDESIAFANIYAPEHLHLKVDPALEDEVVSNILHAGEILIGEDTPSTLGNYGIGVNHVLPTGGWARSYSCTSVWDFLKRTSLSRVDEHGRKALTPSVLTLTHYEDFPAHGDVLRKRK